MPGDRVAASRIATFNLLHGLSLTSGVADEADLRAAAKHLDADVVGLQEVDLAQPRSSGVDQVAAMAEELRAPNWRFVPALYGTPGPGRRWRAAAGGVDSPADATLDRDAPGSGANDTETPSYGVGLISRWPVREWHVLRFPAAPVGLPLLVPSPARGRFKLIPDEPRVALLALIDAPSGPLTVVTSHLSFVPGFNIRQLLAIAKWARRWPSPRLLLGDLNLPGALPSAVTGWQRLARTPTYPSYRPRVQFDHVLSTGISEAAVVDFRVQRLPVSDHCALSIDLLL